MLSKSLLFFKSSFTALYAAPFQLITHFLRLRANTLLHFSPCSPEVALSKLFSISSNAFWIMSKVSVLDHVKGVYLGSCQRCLFGIMSKVSALYLESFRSKCPFSQVGIEHVPVLCCAELNMSPGKCELQINKKFYEKSVRRSQPEWIQWALKNLKGWDV